MGEECGGGDVNGVFFEGRPMEEDAFVHIDTSAKDRTKKKVHSYMNMHFHIIGGHSVREDTREEFYYRDYILLWRSEVLECLVRSCTQSPPTSLRE